MTRTLPAVGPTLLLALLPLSAAGQTAGEPIPLSQFGAVTQRLGTAEISLEYRRPVARGRALFGELVAFGEEWTPSADSAAVLTFTQELVVAGRPVPAGSYSLWFIPREPGSDWTLILSPAARVFHAPFPGGEEQMRVELEPEAGPHMETLSFHFPRVDGPTAILRFHWGPTMVSIPLELPRSDP